MKLTNPESIQESEKEFIDTINAELDWDAIEKMLMEKHGFAIQDEVDYKDGNLVVHHNEIAYKFDFEIKVPLSVIFDRQGDCVEISTVREDAPEIQTDPPEDSPPIEIDASKKNERVEQMASNIADMISQINQGEE